MEEAINNAIYVLAATGLKEVAEPNFYVHHAWILNCQIQNAVNALIANGVPEIARKYGRVHLALP